MDEHLSSSKEGFEDPGGKLSFGESGEVDSVEEGRELATHDDQHPAIGRIDLDLALRHTGRLHGVQVIEQAPGARGIQDKGN